MKALGTAFIALLLAGCSWASASPYEYADYRKTRVEPTFEARIEAANTYLARYPNGAYSKEVRRYYDRAEPVFYETRQRDAAGMQAYLRALPEGPHAREIRSRLRAITEQAALPDSLSAAASATEQRLADAAASRQRARAELTEWLEALVDPAAYRSPLAEGPAELVVSFSLSLPAPICSQEASPDGAHEVVGRTCGKDLTIAYWLPTSRGLTEREMAFTVTLRQDATGRPTSSRIEGEELFSRLEETVALQALAPGDVEARARAVTRSSELVATAFAARVSSDAACRREATPPQSLVLECNAAAVPPSVGGVAAPPSVGGVAAPPSVGGVAAPPSVGGIRVVVSAASEPGDLDAVEITPLF